MYLCIRNFVTLCADAALSLDTMFTTVACFQKDADNLKRIGRETKDEVIFSHVRKKKTKTNPKDQGPVSLGKRKTERGL